MEKFYHTTAINSLSGNVSILQVKILFFNSKYLKKFWTITVMQNNFYSLIASEEIMVRFPSLFPMFLVHFPAELI